MSYSYDDIYVLHAWRDNRRRLTLTQGEGYSGTLSGDYMVKAPHFQLNDERGVIAIPSDTAVSMAITLPNGTEDLVACYPVDKPNGIFCCPIRTTMTSQAGEVKGEVRLTTSSNTVVKFYGIIFYVNDGVSDSAAPQSPAFSALVEALSKVEAVTASGATVAPLDETIQNNGQHPVTSGVIYNYLQGYRQISYAHENYAASYDTGVYIDDATDIMKMYYLLNSNGARIGIIVSVFPLGYSYGMQIKLHNNGRISTRVKTMASGESEYTWKEWTPIGTTNNIQDLAIVTSKIANGAVTEAKLADECITQNKIDSYAVTTAAIANNAVTAAKLNSDVKDTTPTENSSKLLTSGGAYTALKNLDDKKWTFVEIADGDARTISQLNASLSRNDNTIYIAVLKANELFQGSSRQNVTVIQYGSSLRSMIAQCDGLFFSKYSDGIWGNWTAAISTNSIKNDAITLEKIAPSVFETTPTNGSSKLLTSGGVYNYVNGNFRKYVEVSASNLDTATDQQTLYSTYYNGVFCIMYCVSGTTNHTQYLHKSTGEVLYRYQHKSDDTWGDWDEWKLIATQNYSRNSSAPTASTSGKLWDIRWRNDGTYEHCYQLTSIGGTTESPVYNWTEIATSAVLEAIRTELGQSINNQIVTFSYTLTSSDWNSNNEQAITKPSSYVVTSDVMADVEIGSVAFNQLCADGCGGLYISSERSGSNLTLTAHALNNKPTANVTIQVTLTKVNDISGQ